MTPGMSVEPGFTLPWPGRTMAEVLADEQRRERHRNRMVALRAAANAPQVKITPAGKIAYAGYSGREE